MEDAFLFRTKKEYEQTIDKYVQDAKYQEALMYLESISHQVIDSVWLNYTQGRLYNALEQYHLALPYFIKASKQVDESSILYSEIGWTYNRLEQFDEAIYVLEKCVLLGKENYLVYSELAYSYLKKGMLEEGIVYLLNGLDLEPDDLWSLEQLSNAYNDLGNYEEANQVNKRLYPISENDKLLEEIILLNEVNNTMEDQLMYLQLLEPINSYFAYYHYGVYYNLHNQFKKALDKLEMIPKEDRDGETWVELGYSYHQTEDIEKAIYAYEKGYVLSPNHVFLLSELAYLYGLLENDDKKLFYLDEAYNHGRKDLWIYLNYIRVYLYGKKDYNKAHAYLKEADKLTQSDEELQFLWSEYEWGVNKKEEAHHRLLAILTRRLDLALPQSFYEVTYDISKDIHLDIPNIERVYQFNEGLAYIKTNRHGGFIDTKGNLAIGLHLPLDITTRQDTYMFYNQYAIIVDEHEGLYGLIDHSGHDVCDKIYDDIKVYKDYQRLSIGAHTILRFKDKEYIFEEEIGEYKENILPIKKDEQWYYCDLNKNNLFSLSFDEAGSVYQQKAIAKKGNYYGLIDMQGNTLVPFIYEQLTWANDTLIAKKEDNYGVIDTNENTLIDFNYLNIEDGYHNYYCVQGEYGWGMLDFQGETIVPCIYDQILPVFEDLIRVEKNEYYGMYSTTGEIIIPIIYDTLTICKNGYIIAGVGYRYAYMDALGNLLTPFMFQTATLPVDDHYCVSFQNEFYLVNNKKGVI